jgi:hypothetical protein
MTRRLKDLSSAATTPPEDFVVFSPTVRVHDSTGRAMCRAFRRSI